MPPDGGELEIWRGFGRLDGIPVLPPGRPTEDADIVVKPNVGDLVIFDAWHLHAIRRFHSGVRTSLQGFIGPPWLTFTSLGLGGD